MAAANVRNKVFYIYNALMNKYSNSLFRNILTTPPIKTNPNAISVLYTPLSTRYCRAYILAAKSFLRFYSDICVVVQDDGSLTAKDVSEISRHIVGVRVVPYAAMNRLVNDKFSELFRIYPDLIHYDKHINLKIMVLKLLNVLASFDNRKVFLMDSDILVLRKPDVIIKWLQDEYLYDIYTGGGMLLSERFMKLGFPFNAVSVNNFNSGILGVKPKCDLMELEEIFQRIVNIDEGVFREWEIEQALWAVILGSKIYAVNLDEMEEIYVGSGWRTYDELSNKAVFAHFVGAIRFHKLKYLRLARNIVAQINQFAGCLT